MKKKKVRKLLYLDRAKEPSQEVFLDKFKQLFGFSLGEWQERSSTEKAAGGEHIAWADKNIRVGLTAYYPERVYARPRAVKNQAKPILDLALVKREQEHLHEAAVASLNQVFQEIFSCSYDEWKARPYLKLKLNINWSLY